MPVFQYFGWVGSFLLMTLLAANWCFPAPIAPPSDVPLDQKVQIRIHTDHKWPERVVLDTTRATLVQMRKPTGDRRWRKRARRSGGTPTLRRVRRDGAHPQSRVFDRPAPPGCRARALADRERRAISNSRTPVDDGAQGPHFPQSASQAARKKLTRSRTKAGSSLRSSFAPSPIRARMIIGSRMRSMKICAVETLRFGPKGPLEPRESVWVASFRTWDTAAAARSRPCFMDLAAQGRKSFGFGNCGARDADRVFDESFHDLDAQARELVLHRAPFGLKALEIRQSVDDTGHHRLEERLLPGEVSIDGRLARRRRLGDLVETGALITSLEEYPLGCIEDPRFHVARQVFGRSSRTRPFQIIVLAHHRLHLCIHDAASAQAR